jgi:hypothetical protein
LSEALIDPDYESEAMLRKKLRAIIRCARVFGPDTPMPDDVVEFLHSKPEGPHKFVTILADKACQLLALGRYERRAFSRRKFAGLRCSASPFAAMKTGRKIGRRSTPI